MNKNDRDQVHHGQSQWLNTVLYLGTTIVSALLGLASAVILTHLLDPIEFGRIGIFFSVLYIACPIVSLAAEGLIVVNKTKLDEFEYDYFRRTVTAFALISSVVLQTILSILWIFGALSDPILQLIPLFSLLRFASSMASLEYIAEQRAGTYAALTLLNNIMALALSFLLISQVFTTAYGRILALMGAETVMLMFRYWGRLDYLIKPRIETIYRRQILAFGLPSMIALFGAWALNESDKTTVAHSFGLTTAGLYTAAATMAAIMASFNQSLSNAFTPNLFTELRKGDRLATVGIRWLLRFLGINFTFAMLVVITFILLKEEFLPDKYANAATYFYALVAASLGVAVYRPYGLIAEYFQMARIRAIAIVSGGVVTIFTGVAGMRWLETPIMAAVGIGAGYLVTSGILVIAIRSEIKLVIMRNTESKVNYTSLD
jgi:O-antigen/teichoic acid export membrane protein